MNISCEYTCSQIILEIFVKKIIDVICQYLWIKFQELSLFSLCLPTVNCDQNLIQIFTEKVWRATLILMLGCQLWRQTTYSLSMHYWKSKLWINNRLTVYVIPYKKSHCSKLKFFSENSVWISFLLKKQRIPDLEPSNRSFFITILKSSTFQNYFNN